MCRACVQDASATGGASDRLSGPGTTQPEPDRVSILVGLQGRAVTRVEPPQPRVVNVRVTELSEAGARGPRTPRPRAFVAGPREHPRQCAQ